MAIWKEFEEASTEFLNKTFGDYATFVLQGGSNSKKEDILVNTKKGKEFYIEAKHSPAQCGQFVLLPDIQTKKFDYSKQNIAPLNEYSQQIINYMNTKFEEYKESGTAGKDIVFPNCENVFINWILSFYINEIWVDMI